MLPLAAFLSRSLAIPHDITILMNAQMLRFVIRRILFLGRVVFASLLRPADAVPASG